MLIQSLRGDADIRVKTGNLMEIFVNDYITMITHYNL